MPMPAETDVTSPKYLRDKYAIVGTALRSCSSVRAASGDTLGSSRQTDREEPQ